VASELPPFSRDLRYIFVTVASITLQSPQEPSVKLKMSTSLTSEIGT
jgi:hypothetical protein